MIDGTDSNVTVDIAVADVTLPQFDFGFVSGGNYTRITNFVGSWTFQGGNVVDFALRNWGADNTFGTGDDLIYDIANPLDYANQTYSVPIDPSHSQNPVVSSPYYRALTLTWDLNHDGVADTGFDLSVTTPLLTYDGMAPVPLPAAAWLFGSGLLGLGALARRRRST